MFASPSKANCLICARAVESVVSIVTATGRLSANGGAPAGAGETRLVASRQTNARRIEFRIGDHLDDWTIANIT